MGKHLDNRVRDIPDRPAVDDMTGDAIGDRVRSTSSGQSTSRSTGKVAAVRSVTASIAYSEMRGSTRISETTVRRG